MVPCETAANTVLQESERRFRLLFEQNPQPMWIYDAADFRILDVNECAVKTYGYTRDEFLGLTLFDLRPDGEHDRLSQHLAARRCCGPPASGPWQHRKKDGATMQVLVTSQPTEFAGRPARFVTVEDVTARLAAETALRHAEGRYRSLVEATAHLVWTSDAADTVLRPAGRNEFTGHDRDELRAPDWLARLHPDDQERTVAAWREAVRSGSKYEIEHRIRKSNGEYAIMYGRAVPVRDESGAIREWIGVHTDVTRERIAEQQLRASERRFRHVFSDCASGIALVDGVTHEILQVNPAMAGMLGYTPDELVGRLFEEITHLGDIADDCGHLERLMAGETSSYQMQKRYIHKSGSEVWAELTVSVTHERRGESLVVLAVVEDVTARKALETQLSQSQKMEAIGRLAGGIAHDFNNLLTVILGHVELMERSPDALPVSLKEVRKAAERAAGLTRQLLTFSRRYQPALETADLNLLVHDMASMLGRLLGEGVRLQIEAGGAPALVRCDPHQMQQAVMNLAVNARDAMAGHGTLRLAVSQMQLGAEEAAARGLKPGAHVRLLVADTGCGMDGRTQAQIFEPFFTTKPPGQGTGLGLPIVYAAVRQCRGAITVRSELGNGAEFQMILPCADSGPVAAQRNEPARSVRVLLVEDEAGLRKFVKVLLEQAGYSVCEAAEPAAALRAACREPKFDVVVSDVVMPQMSGPELVRELQRQQPTIKVVLMSGYPEHGSLRNELECAYLQKPFRPEALLHLIAANLRN
jgi:two-component system, cell cycle sensor histidine kinase and response regulator CckA